MLFVIHGRVDSDPGSGPIVDPEDLTKPNVKPGEVSSTVVGSSGVVYENIRVTDDHLGTVDNLITGDPTYTNLAHGE
jgi:hypothetical protein